MEHIMNGSEVAQPLAAALPGPVDQEGKLGAGSLKQVLAGVVGARLPSTAAGLVAVLKVTAVLINALAALQARAQAGLLEARKQEARDQGNSVRTVRGHVVQEVALAAHLSPYQASRSVQRALQLPERLPRIWSRFVSGEISEERAAMALTQARVLNPEQATDLDAHVAPHLGEKSKREAEQVVRRAVIDADPEAAAARVSLAQGERHVSARPTGDAMIAFFASIPGVEGQAIWTGLERRAAAMRGGGDQRNKEQIKADLFSEALLSYLTYLEDTDSTRPQRPRPGIQIQLVMTDAALFGFSDTTASVHGLGPVPAPIARTWAQEAVETERAELVRLWTAPDSGKLVAMDSKQRRFPASLARYVVTRDQICRTPWCGAPIRHIDHVRPHADGGATSLANAQGLCVQCNEHKDGPGWSHTADVDGAITTRPPSGEKVTTRPAELPHESRPAA